MRIAGSGNNISKGREASSLQCVQSEQLGREQSELRAGSGRVEVGKGDYTKGPAHKCRGTQD